MENEIITPCYCQYYTFNGKILSYIFSGQILMELRYLFMNGNSIPIASWVDSSKLRNDAENLTFLDKSFDVIK